MTVHFICEGNTYRSRLAEAYLKSLKIPGLKVISSGTLANMNLNGSISRYTQILIEKYGISSYGKQHWDQLTQARINQSDIIVCLNRQIYHDCRAGYKLPLRTFIWDIPDVKALLPSYAPLMDQKIAPDLTETTFHKIRLKVDELVVLIRKPRSSELIDVLNHDGSPTHKTANVDEIHQKGLWHNGAHIGLFTKDGRVVIEKRSQNIIQNPGLWDLSLGGLVASGETPESTIIRETYEEIGLRLKQQQLQKLFVLRYDHYLPQYGLHNKVFVHTYIALINGSTKFKIQKSEADDARLVPISEARKMIEGIKINDLGEMTSTRSFYQRILNSVAEKIH